MTGIECFHKSFSSFVPQGVLHLHSIDLTSFITCEILLDQPLVDRACDIEFARLHVLHHWDLLQILVHVDIVATNEKHSLDLEVGLLAEHGKPTESEAPEAFQPLDEAHQ